LTPLTLFTYLRRKVGDFPIGTTGGHAPVTTANYPMVKADIELLEKLLAGKEVKSEEIS
jgi:hypothetical protein